MFGIRTGLIAGFVLGSMLWLSPGCEYFETGRLSEQQVAQVNDMGAKIKLIDEAMPLAEAELERLRIAYEEMAAKGEAGAALAAETASEISILQTAYDSTKEERGQIMASLTAIQASVGPDGEIDWSAAATAATPLLAMVPGLNFIVPLLPILGAGAGAFWKQKKVKYERAENAENMLMAEHLSIGSIGIIDSIQAIKKAIPADTDAGAKIRQLLGEQPQQSRFLVSAIRGNGFAGERMAPILQRAQGSLSNQARK